MRIFFFFIVSRTEGAISIAAELLSSAAVIAFCQAQSFLPSRDMATAEQNGANQAWLRHAFWCASSAVSYSVYPRVE